LGFRVAIASSFQTRHYSMIMPALQPEEQALALDELEVQQ
jgi:hypothetical protein